MSNVQRPLSIFNLVCNHRKAYLPLPQLYGETLMKELSSRLKDSVESSKFLGVDILCCMLD